MEIQGFGNGFVGIGPNGSISHMNDVPSGLLNSLISYDIPSPTLRRQVMPAVALKSNLESRQDKVYGVASNLVLKVIRDVQSLQHGFCQLLNIGAVASRNLVADVPWLEAILHTEQSRTAGRTTLPVALKEVLRYEAGLATVEAINRGAPYRVSAFIRAVSPCFGLRRCNVPGLTASTTSDGNGRDRSAATSRRTIKDFRRVASLYCERLTTVATWFCGTALPTNVGAKAATVLTPRFVLPSATLTNTNTGRAWRSIAGHRAILSAPDFIGFALIRLAATVTNYCNTHTPHYIMNAALRKVIHIQGAIGGG